MAEAAPPVPSGLGRVKKVWLILSGKGGVGKSTMSAQLAVTLAATGSKVALLDVDLCGPSIPRVLGLEGKEVMQSTEGWMPVLAGEESNPVAVMSIAFLLKSTEEAVVWRGPKKNAMIKQFLEDTVWGERDYLLIDTPPGTSDEQISTIEHLKASGCVIEGAVMVTTPQDVSVVDVRKEISFCQKMQVPVLGLVENMAGFVCPCCDECTDIFSRGGGEALATAKAIPFLGRVPLDPRVAACMDAGTPLSKAHPESPAALALLQVLAKLRKP